MHALFFKEVFKNVESEKTLVRGKCFLMYFYF